MGQLQFVFLVNCSQLSDIMPLQNLGNLKALYLRDCSQLSDMTPLQKLKKLQFLDLTGCDALVSIPEALRKRAEAGTLRLDPPAHLEWRKQDVWL